MLFKLFVLFEQRAVLAAEAARKTNAIHEYYRNCIFVDSIVSLSKSQISVLALLPRRSGETV